MKRLMTKKIALMVVAVALVGGVVGYATKREVLIQGKTMGTTYHIKVISHGFRNTRSLPEKIEAKLKDINQSMSVFLENSEISRFNRLSATGKTFPVSEDFYQVMALAEKIHLLTEKSWDGTVMPLVNLWGFGYRGMKISPPDAAAIQAARKRVGFGQIKVGEDRSLVKLQKDVTIDLASIAKGYGVDAVARVIRENGFSNFLVEIGGEVYAAGVRKDGNPWRVGINRPEKDAAPTQVYRALPLKNQALATSGDYRNFFEVNGVHYAHVIDPRTGYPVSNGVVSVSILSDNCTVADGLATALMVMGHEKGLKLVNQLPLVECFIVVREADGTFTDYLSHGFTMGD